MDVTRPDHPKCGPMNARATLYVVLRPGGSQQPLARAPRPAAERERLALGLFMWVHMFFVSSILLGKDAMWTVARFFEGYFFFGRPLPWLVSLLVATVFALFIGHAALALRKFPASYRQYRTTATTWAR